MSETQPTAAARSIGCRLLLAALAFIHGCFEHAVCCLAACGGCLCWLPSCSACRPYKPPQQAWTRPYRLALDASLRACTPALACLPACCCSKRFSLVPLGPPLLTYSSTANKAVLRFDPESHEIQLAVDRAYQPGEPILAWCGPQVSQ